MLPPKLIGHVGDPSADSDLNQRTQRGNTARVLLGGSNFIPLIQSQLQFLRSFINDLYSKSDFHLSLIMYVQIQVQHGETSASNSCSEIVKTGYTRCDALVEFFRSTNVCCVSFFPLVYSMDSTPLLNLYDVESFKIKTRPYT